VSGRQNPATGGSTCPASRPRWRGRDGTAPFSRYRRDGSANSRSSDAAHGTRSAVPDALPPELRALVTLAAGTGMRQGERFGLTVDRMRFLERMVAVDRQLVTVQGQAPTLAPPKTKASNRTIPLPQVVVDALAAHLAAFSAGLTGSVFTWSGKPITRSVFGHKWRAAVETSGLPAGAPPTSGYADTGRRSSQPATSTAGAAVSGSSPATNGTWVTTTTTLRKRNIMDQNTFR
jgi:integrase